jgi:hypothetical protein
VDSVFSGPEYSSSPTLTTETEAVTVSFPATDSYGDISYGNLTDVLFPTVSLGLIFEEAPAEPLPWPDALLDDLRLVLWPTDRMVQSSLTSLEVGLNEPQYRESTGVVPDLGTKLNDFDDGFIDIGFTVDGLDTIQWQEADRERREWVAGESTSGQLAADAYEPSATADGRLSDRRHPTRGLDEAVIEDLGRASAEESKLDGATAGVIGAAALQLAPDPDARGMIELWPGAEVTAAARSQTDAGPVANRRSGRSGLPGNHPAPRGVEVDESCGMAQAFELATVSERVLQDAPVDRRHEPTNGPPAEPSDGLPLPASDRAADDDAEGSAAEDANHSHRKTVAALAALLLVAPRRRGLNALTRTLCRRPSVQDGESPRE